MQERKWIVALFGLLACGLIAAGCGNDNADTSTTTSGGETSTTQSADSGGSTPDDVYQACLDVIAGTPAEPAGESVCAHTRDAFANCTEQANQAPEGTARDAAIEACQKAADAATSALKAGS